MKTPHLSTLLAGLLLSATHLAHGGPGVTIIDPPYLTGVIRDFREASAAGGHPDFEMPGVNAVVPGAVAAELGADGLPVFHDTGSGQYAGEAAFNQWFRDVPGTNLSSPLRLELTDGCLDGGTFVFRRNQFFPIDNQLFGNGNRPHNYHFTAHLHGVFAANGSEFIRAVADDDLWIFVNGRRVIDLGGRHPASSASVVLDAAELGILPGSTSNRLDLFFAERRTTESVLSIETNLKLHSPGTAEPAAGIPDFGLQPVRWNAASGSWNNPNNWSPPQVPGTNDLALVCNDGTIYVDQPVEVGGLVVTRGVVTHATGNIKGVALTVRTSVHVGPGGAIDVSEAGYLGGAREGNTFGSLAQSPGAGGLPASGANAGGGSHGNTGGPGRDSAGYSNPVYGSATAPVHLGSGGGAYNAPGWLGGNGGGRIHIRTKNLIVDGALRANGGLSFRPDTGAYGQRGAGSGGSIFVELDGGDFAGTGLIEARGGTSSDPYYVGGDGRIAIVGFTSNAFTGTSGQAATFFTQPSGTGGHLRFDRAYLTIPSGSSATFTSFSATTNGGTLYNYGTLAMSDDALVLNPWVSFLQQGVLKGAHRTDDRIGSITVRSNGVMWHARGNTNGLQLDVAGTVAVEAGGVIDVSEAGYLGGAREGNTFGSIAETLGAGGLPASGANAGGGSHGSAGGPGRDSAGYSNPVYGSATAPVHLGSGGGAYNAPGWLGGNGGGRIHIRTKHLIVDGTLRANGGLSFRPDTGAYAQRGAGSGGSIFVELDGGDFAGTGLIEARGGTSSDPYYVGGDGRIAIVGFTSNAFTGISGQAATFFTQPSGTGGHLRFDRAYLTIPSGSSATFTSFSATTNGGTLYNYGTLAMTEDSLVIHPHLSFLQQGVIKGAARPDNWIGSITVRSNGVMWHVPGNTNGLQLAVAGALIVEAGGALDASELGYLGGARPGNGYGSVAQAGSNDGAMVQGANSGAGSYGSAGGSGNGYSNPVYGSATAPIHLGSGGGAYNAPGWLGGNGGGRIHIRTKHLIVDGALRANGGPSYHPDTGTFRRRGAGSGGSIFVELAGGDFAGTGVIEARGGPADEAAYAGGCGRIAIVGHVNAGFSGVVDACGSLYLNARPKFGAAPDLNLPELSPLSAPNPATDADPGSLLTYTLLDGPPGATISDDGIITWQTKESDGPGVYTFTTRAVDNALVPLSATNSFQLVVEEVNTHPLLATPAPITVNAGQRLQVPLEATDSDLPRNRLEFRLVDPPPGAQLTGGNQFEWRPPVSFSDTTNQIRMRVEDDGQPALSDERVLTVVVRPLETTVQTATKAANGSLGIVVTGSQGPDLVIQESADLVEWTDLEIHRSPGMPFEWTAPSDRSTTQRFYRIQLQP